MFINGQLTNAMAHAIRVTEYNKILISVSKDIDEVTNVIDDNGSGTAVSIPPTYEGKPVTGIKENSFENKTAIESIIIPSSVTALGEAAFKGCTSLNGVTIGDSVATIGIGAFENCTNLAALTIPSSVIEIGDNVFNGCSALSSITMLPSTPPTLGSGVFTGTDSDMYIRMPEASVAGYRAASNWSSYSSDIDGVSDSVLVAEDKAALIEDSIRSSNANLDNVTSGLTLPLSGTNGSSISWVSGNTGVIANDGTVVRSSSGGNATVTLTATISRGGSTDTKVFTVIVLEFVSVPVSDFAYTAKTDTTVSLSWTAATGATGVKIQQSPSGASTWTDSTHGALNAASTSGTVTGLTCSTAYDFRLVVTGGGNAGASNIITQTTSAADPEDISAVASDKTALTDAVITGSNTDLNNVKVNLYLPASGANGSAISWSSNSTGVISNNGTVTRPASGASDVSVTLTATITRGSAVDTKQFTVTVIKLSAASYSITFNINGGTSGTMENQMIDSGATAVLIANTFTRTGYVFSGWAETSGGGVAYNDKQAYTMGGANVTLYAVWSLSSSLMIHYGFDGQNCLDSSGNGKNGTASNITYVSDGNGGYSASFNGTSSYVALPYDTIRSTTTFTVMMRFKTSTASKALLGYQVGTPGGSSGTFVPILYINSSGYLVGDLWNGTAHFTVTSTVTVTNDTWHTVYFSAKASSIALYLDGSQIGIQASTVNHLSMFNNQIGASYLTTYFGLSDNWYYFNGLIDDFYFYNTALH